MTLSNFIILISIFGNTKALVASVDLKISLPNPKTPLVDPKTCLSPLQNYYTCFNDIYVSQKDNIDAKAVNVAGIANDIYECYEKNECNVPLNWKNSWPSAFNCWNNFYNKQVEFVNKCVQDNFYKDTVAPDNETLASIIVLLRPTSWRPVNFVKGWLGGGERPHLLDESTISASCDTATKQDAVRTCTATVRANAVDRFENYRQSMDACWSNATSALGFECFRVYKRVMAYLCLCSGRVRTLEAETIYQDTPACSGITYETEDNAKSVAIGTIQVCDLTAKAALRDYDHWWKTGNLNENYQ